LYILSRKKNKMTEQTNNQTINENDNRLNLNINTLSYKLYKEYFILGNHDKQELARLHQTSLNNISSIVSRLKSKLIQSTSSTPEIVPIVPQNTNLKQKNVHLVLEFNEDENNELYLYVKTSKEFEDYLKANKEVSETTNLWNRQETSKFYKFKLIDNYLDEINSPIFYRNMINFGVLRIPGISDGIKYKVDGVLDEPMLISAMNKLKKVYSDFYVSRIVKNRINLKLQIVEEVLEVIQNV